MDIKELNMFEMFCESNYDNVDIAGKLSRKEWKLLQIGKLNIVVGVTINNELNVHFAEGENIKDASKTLDNLCLNNGLEKIVCYTNKPAMARYLKQFGYSTIEINDKKYKMVKELNHV